MTTAELNARAEALVQREKVMTIVGDKATVNITKTNVCGIVTYEVQHPCFKCPGNPRGVYVTNDFERMSDLARMIAKEGEAYA